MYGYEAVAKTIETLGFGQVFGVMGNGNLAWLSYAVEQKLFDYIPVRREDAAIGAAAGYARSSGKVGIATVTHGPGLGNSFTALTAAVKDNSPIVVVIGVPALSNPHSLQRMDHSTFTMLTGAAYHKVEKADKIGTIIARATVEAAAQQRPQVVGIYHDLFEAEVSEKLIPKMTIELGPARRAPSADDVAQAIDMIASAERPLILAGQGAVVSGARSAVETFGDDIGALYADTMLARHFFAGNPHLVGMVGISSHPLTDRLIAETDLVLVVGASLNWCQTRHFKLFENKKIILVENDVSRLPNFHPLDLVLDGDARSTVSALHKAWRERGLDRRQGARTSAALERLQEFHIYSPSEDTSSDRGVDPRAFYASLDAQLPDDRLIVTDGGRVMETLHHLMNASSARGYLYGSGFAAIGLGLGMSIGAGAANPDRTLLHVSGDGGFMMSAQELDTVVRSGVQMLVCVMNDCQYGSEIRHIEHMAHRGHKISGGAAQFETPYLDALARSYGGDGEVIATKADVENFTLTPEKLRGLYLVDVRVDPGFDAWKVWAPGKFS